MSIKQVILKVCDRCGKKEELSTGDGSFQDHKPNKLKVTLGAETLLEIEDLCARCTPRVQTLLANLKMEKQPKKEEQPALAD